MDLYGDVDPAYDLNPAYDKVRANKGGMNKVLQEALLQPPGYYNRDPLRFLGFKELTELYAAGVTAAARDGRSALTITQGPAYLTMFPNFEDFRSVVVNNMRGFSTKTVSRASKVAATALSATLTSTVIYGVRVTFYTPVQLAPGVGINFTATFTGAATLTCEFFNRLKSTDFQGGVFQGIILAVSDNAGQGAPAGATAVTVSAPDGQAGLVDASTRIEVESLNLRDISSAMSKLAR